MCSFQHLCIVCYFSCRALSTEKDDPNELCRNAENIEKCDNNGKWSEYTVPYTKRKETYRYRYCEALEADTSVDEVDYNSCILEEIAKTT